MPANLEFCESQSGAETIASRERSARKSTRVKGKTRWHTILDHDVQALLDEQVRVEDNKAEG
jgi:hypothetical protein